MLLLTVTPRNLLPVLLERGLPARGARSVTVRDTTDCIVPPGGVGIIVDNMGNIKNYGRSGFTLLELVTVMAILSILAGILFGNFTNSLMKGRDSRRKEDLSNVQKALEVYYYENNLYPTTAVGLLGGLPWTSALTDTKAFPKTFMQKLPQDPFTSAGYRYDYQSDGSYYKLYTCLENVEDPVYAQITGPADCGDGCANTCRYGIASGNAVP